ncbi:MAG: APC family permease [Bacteroidota bacterium]
MPANSRHSSTVKTGLVTAISVVAANMIGTGIFTSLGFQLDDIPRPFTILVLWAVGGIVALCGAFSYGELGSVFPRSGGEYHFLQKLYHPLAGFLAGWVSFVAGFSAPVAAAAIAAGQYGFRVFADIGWIPGDIQAGAVKVMACFMALLIAWVHTRKMKTISLFQNFFTWLKVALILVLIGAGFTLATPQDISFAPGPETLSSVFSGAFAVSLVFVMYSYSGWNASAYIINDIRNPRRNLPMSLFLGTLLVALLYIPVNGVFLYSTPMDIMAGKEEVGYIAGQYIFGETGGIIMGVLISLGLVSAISSMTWAGPRVIQVMGEDYKILRFFAAMNRNRIPVRAIAIQTTLVLLMVLTSTFEQVIYFVGFTLTLSSFLAVLGVYIIRARGWSKDANYKTWGYPVTPALFLAVSGWMMIYIVIDQPRAVLFSLLTLLIGVIIYYMEKVYKKRYDKQTTNTKGIG